MTRSQFINAVATRSGLPRQVAAQAVSLFFDTLTEALCEGRRIEIRGLGSFRVKAFECRTAHNPKTGSPVEVAPKVRPSFRMGKEIRERLNEGFVEHPSTPHITEWEE